MNKLVNLVGTSLCVPGLEQGPHIITHVGTCVWTSHVFFIWVSRRFKLDKNDFLYYTQLNYYAPRVKCYA